MSSGIRKTAKSSQKNHATSNEDDDSPSQVVKSNTASIGSLIGSFLFIALSVWAIYVNFYSEGNTPEYAGAETILKELANPIKVGDGDPATSLGQLTQDDRTAMLVKELNEISATNGQNMSMYQNYHDRLPVLGPMPTNGLKPLFNMKHQGGDAIFALACNYPKLFYQRFVGSLRKTGYKDDIVLAVSPLTKMKPGVQDYLKKMKVVSYAFEVDCSGIDNCKLKDDFLGYPDPRPFRTFANIRYALYEYWLQYYDVQSYVLILDFRDTFFQLNPFESFGPLKARTPAFELKLYAENSQVKTIGTCVFNSLWIGRCFGKSKLTELKPYPVLCSGSTLGSYQGIYHYIRTMLKSMDTVKCWLKGIESDQGYQNYLYYHGHFNPPNGMIGNVTAYQQGEGIVNTIGAMNGFRVSKDKTGSLDSYWKIRNKDGFILNNDGSLSPCVHQWDRWYKDLRKFVDTKTF